jgi:alpha-amylase/alpha-mannosidase (GH57 family)
VAGRITVHGHFYQPPRENPWTGEIDVQPGAAPYRDWNARVHDEAYRPNTRVTLPGGRGEVDNFRRMSFDVGPTLLEWMAEADPGTYRRIVDADHGNALAQAYHHTILPLSPVRDIRTQIRWGLRDFELRFGRRSEGIWLPECAIDERTADVLIEEGVGFTILSPAQARYWREPEGAWQDVADQPLDTTVAYRCAHSDGSGRYVTALFYDGGISHAIAFDGAAASAEGLTDLFEAGAREGCHLAHAATDGETYGHHHKFGDIGLAYALFVEAPDRGLEVVDYPSFLRSCPAERWVRLPATGTSWSCAHGVGRWKEDCGCSTGGEPGWNQKWRGPLRRALDAVRQAADYAYERRGREVFAHPWRARDRYVDVVAGARSLEDFVAAEGAQDGAAPAEPGLLLELQRNALSMFTSCGWFFNDLAGIETIQVMLYAARTMDLLEQLGETPPSERFLAILAEAESNDPDAGTGAEIYERAVGAARP